MANIEYAHPFRSALEGQTTALSNIQKAQAARESDLDYGYNKWYQPLKQAQQQSAVGGELLKQAAAIAHYTGDYSNYNAILAHYLGVPLERLPPGYGAGKGTQGQTKAADLSTNLLPTPFAYNNVFGAGGVGAYPDVPGKPDPDPVLHKAQRDAALRYWQSQGNPGGAGAVPAEPNVNELNPLYGIPDTTVMPQGPAAPVTTPQPAQPMAQPPPIGAPIKVPGADATAADATKSLGTTDAASAYGIPTPKKSSGPSIFEGEYDPQAFSAAN